MESSILLLSCSIHSSKKVADQLRDVSGIEDAIPVYGIYDCIVKTKKMSSNDIRNVVLKNIQKLDDVYSVLPLQINPE